MSRVIEKFQVMPPLSSTEYAELQSAIVKRGVLVPVVFDQHGNIIDGHNRVEIADKHNLSYVREVIEIDDDDHGRELAVTLNVTRRQLDKSQRDRKSVV